MSVSVGGFEVYMPECLRGFGCGWVPNNCVVVEVSLCIFGEISTLAADTHEGALKPSTLICTFQPVTRRLCPGNTTPVWRKCCPGEDNTSKYSSQSSTDKTVSVRRTLKMKGWHLICSHPRHSKGISVTWHGWLIFYQPTTLCGHWWTTLE